MCILVWGVLLEGMETGRGYGVAGMSSEQGREIQESLGEPRAGMWEVEGL